MKEAAAKNRGERVRAIREEDLVYETFLINNSTARKETKEAYQSHKAGDLVNPRSVFG